MLLGALALACHSLLVQQILLSYDANVILAAGVRGLAWLLVAFGL